MPYIYLHPYQDNPNSKVTISAPRGSYGASSVYIDEDTWQAIDSVTPVPSSGYAWAGTWEGESNGTLYPGEYYSAEEDFYPDFYEYDDPDPDPDNPDPDPDNPDPDNPGGEDTPTLVTIKYKDPTGTLSESEDWTYYYPQDGYGYFTPPNISKTNTNGQEFMWWQESDGTIYYGGEESFIGNKDITLYAYWGSSTTEYPGSNKIYTVNYYLDSNKTLFKQEYVWANEQDYSPSYKVISDIPVASSTNLKFDKWDYPTNSEQWPSGRIMELMGNPVELFAMWKDVSSILRAQAFLGVSTTGEWNDLEAKEKGYNSLNDVLEIINSETPLLISTYHAGDGTSSLLPKVRWDEADGIYNYNADAGGSYGLINFETFHLTKEGYYPKTDEEWRCSGNGITDTISDDGPWTCQQLIKHLRLTPINKGTLSDGTLICKTDHYYFDAYPEWSNDDIITVTFNLNGGDGSIPDESTSYPASDNGVAIPYDSPSNTRTVYFDSQGGTSFEPMLLKAKFSYWLDKAVDNQTDRKYNSGEYYYRDKDTTLYATWQPRESIILPTPVKTNYKFKGWATSPTADSGFTGSYTTEINLTLYAIWEATPFKTFIKENGVWKKGTIFMKDNSWKQGKPYTKNNQWR